MPAHKQRMPDLLFQRLDLPAERGLGQAHFRARLGEAQMARCGVKAFQEVERRNFRRFWHA